MILWIRVSNNGCYFAEFIQERSLFEFLVSIPIEMQSQLNLVIMIVNCETSCDGVAISCFVYTLRKVLFKKRLIISSKDYFQKFIAIKRYQNTILTPWLRLSYSTLYLRGFSLLKLLSFFSQMNARTCRKTASPILLGHSETP